MTAVSLWQHPTKIGRAMAVVTLCRRGWVGASSLRQMLSSAQWEASLVGVPFVCRLDRLHSDCLRLGCLLETKLAVLNVSWEIGSGNGHRQHCAEQKKMRATSSTSSRETQAMAPSHAQQQQDQTQQQHRSRLTLVTHARLTQQIRGPANFVGISKSLPPTPPESVRTVGHSVQVQQKSHRPARRHSTIPQPFRLSYRSPVPCRFATRHLEAMLEERRRKEEAELHKGPFRAKPVPASTYRADSDIRIGQLKRRKRTVSMPDKSAEKGPMRHRSVPLSTYIRPNSSMEETIKLRIQRRAIEQLANAKGPSGMEAHSIGWRIRWRLRHSVRCLPPPVAPRHRSLSVPDFALLHAKFQRQLAANRQIRQTTTPQPFRLTMRPFRCKTEPRK